jgi:L-aspartate oxidase
MMADLPQLIETDVLIIGCGVAGASLALELAKHRDVQITVITKAEDPHESNTYHAQGGIIYKGDEDSPEMLARDLIRAGDGINNPQAVEILAHDGPRLVKELLIGKYGVPFSLDADQELELTREAAHSTARILHVNDATGRAVQEKLMEALGKEPNVRLITGHTAVDLLTPAHHSRNRLALYEPISCVGAYVFDQGTGVVRTILAKCTVLASGGLGQVFLHTTNPEGATGDGLAMAYRAGARIINAEYVQFHPTTFYHRGQARFLISETFRGEGARLLNIEGQPFMQHYAPEWKDLAPRDVVARSIHQEMLRTGAPYVYLDITSAMAPDKVEERFPLICAKCREYGLDATREPIPVVPAAHYFCGGVWVDEWGRTDLDRLYAVGEVSCTGLHGANRLGSASLLEGLVWGTRAAQDIGGRLPEWNLHAAEDIPSWREEHVTDAAADPALVELDMSTVKHTMWFYVGLIRTRRRLERALHDLNSLHQEVVAFYRTTRLDTAVISLRNAVLSALIVAQAAWENRESRGCHYRED